MLVRQLHVLMEDMPIILTPMAAEPPYPVSEDIVSAGRTRELMSAQWPSMAVPFLGMPGISVPVRVHDGLPIGVQLIGRRFREDTLFDAAEVIEARSEVRTPIDPRG
jgi:amidase